MSLDSKSAEPSFAKHPDLRLKELKLPIQISQPARTEVTLFADEDIEQYIAKSLTPEHALKLQGFLKQHSSIWSLAHTPKNLEVICGLWQQPKGISSKKLSLTALCQHLSLAFFQRSSIALTYPVAENILAELAFISLRKQPALITTDDFNHIFSQQQMKAQARKKCREQILKLEILSSGGKPDAAGKYSYHFNNPILQAYYTACYVADSYKQSPSSERHQLIVEFTSQCRYHPRYQIMWGLVAGILSQEASPKPLQLFFDQLLGESDETLSLGKWSLWLGCLGEANIPRNWQYTSTVLQALTEYTIWLMQGNEYADSRWRILLHDNRRIAEDSNLQQAVLNFLQDSDDPLDKETALTFFRDFLPQKHLQEALISQSLHALQDEDGNEEVSEAASEVLTKFASQTSPAIQLMLLDRLLLTLQVKDPEQYIEHPGPEPDEIHYLVSNYQIAANTLAQFTLQLTPENQRYCLQRLLTLMQESDIWGNKLAVETLAQLGTLAPLIPVKDRSAWLDTLLRLLPNEDEDIQQAATNTFLQFAQHLPENTLEYLTSLWPMLTGKKFFQRKLAAEILTRFIPPNMPAYQPKWLQSLLSALPDPEYEVQQAVMFALVHFTQHATVGNQRECINRLLKMLQHTKVLWREVAAKTLAQLTPPSHPDQLVWLRALLKILEQNDPVIKEAVTAALCRFARCSSPTNQSMTITLLQSALNRPKQTLRHAVIQALQELALAAIPANIPQCRDILLRALGDRDLQVGLQAIKGLGQLNPAVLAKKQTLYIAGLIRLIQQDSELPWIKELAINALASFVPQVLPPHALTCFTTLTTQLKSINSLVRQAAVSALAAFFTKLPAKNQLHCLTSFLSLLADKAPDVQQAAINALANLIPVISRENSLKCFGALITIMNKPSKNPSVSATAINALSKFVPLPSSHQLDYLNGLLLAIGDKDFDRRETAVEVLAMLIGQRLLSKENLEKCFNTALKNITDTNHKTKYIAIKILTELVKAESLQAKPDILQLADWLDKASEQCQLHKDQTDPFGEILTRLSLVNLLLVYSQIPKNIPAITSDILQRLMEQQISLVIQNEDVLLEYSSGEEQMLRLGLSTIKRLTKDITQEYARQDMPNLPFLARLSIDTSPLTTVSPSAAATKKPPSPGRNSQSFFATASTDQQQLPASAKKKKAAKKSSQSRLSSK